MQKNFEEACWVKISADDTFKSLFLFFPEKKSFDISCKLSPKQTICMKCQSLLSVKNTNNVISLLPAVFSQRIININKAKAEINLYHSLG